MAELIHVQGAVTFTGEVSDATVENLVSEGQLPGDFYFRLLGVDEGVRTEVATQDVLAALQQGPPSAEATNYLHGDLPNCVYLPGDDSIKKVLQGLDEDYYRQKDLIASARESGTKDKEAKLVWEMLVGHFNPQLYERFTKLLNPDVRRKEAITGGSFEFNRALGRTVVRDTAVMNIVQGKDKISRLGPKRKGLLHNVLKGNHPELDPICS